MAQWRILENLALMMMIRADFQQQESTHFLEVLREYSCLLFKQHTHHTTHNTHNTLSNIINSGIFLSNILISMNIHITHAITTNNNDNIDII